MQWVQLFPHFFYLLWKVIGNSKIAAFRNDDERFNKLFVVEAGKLDNNRSTIQSILEHIYVTFEGEAT